MPIPKESRVPDAPGAWLGSGSHAWCRGVITGSGEAADQGGAPVQPSWSSR